MESKKIELETKSKQEMVDECKEVIKCAARYERLMANKDFQDALKDAREIKETHENQVKGWAKQLEGVSYFKSMRLLEVIKVHQIRANQINELLNYIPKLIHDADLAREYLKSEEAQFNGSRN